MSAQHTQEPWTIHVEPVLSKPMAAIALSALVDGTKDFSGVLPMIVGVNGLCTAVTGCGPDGAANATRIVQCVNAHDKLVLALRSARALLERCGPHLQGVGQECCGQYEAGDGGEYMGQREVVPVCCDHPIDLSDHVANELGVIDAALAVAAGSAP